MHVHTHLLEAVWRQLEVLGIRHRDKVSLEPWLELLTEDSFSMLYAERECVQVEHLVPLSRYRKGWKSQEVGETDLQYTQSPPEWFCSKMVKGVSHLTVWVFHKLRYKVICGLCPPLILEGKVSQSRIKPVSVCLPADHFTPRPNQLTTKVFSCISCKYTNSYGQTKLNCFIWRFVPKTTVNVYKCIFFSFQWYFQRFFNHGLPVLSF